MGRKFARGGLSPENLTFRDDGSEQKPPITGLVGGTALESIKGKYVMHTKVFTSCRQRFRSSPSARTRHTRGMQPSAILSQ